MLVIRGATVFPGDGPPRNVDVGLVAGTIVALGGELSGDVVDAEGLWLCPGFIDVHAHTALARLRGSAAQPRPSRRA